MSDEKTKRNQYKWAAVIGLVGSGVFALLTVALFVWKGLPESKEAIQATITFLVILIYFFGSGCYMWKKYKESDLS